MGTSHEGRVAVVTGAAGGIGRATVARLAGDGARVLAADLDAGTLAAAMDGIEGEIVHATADVTREEEVSACLARAVEAFGGIDCVFNNAGIEGDVAPIEAYSSEVYHQVIAVNVNGVFFGMKHAIPHLLARGGGAIVNTASTAGLQGGPLLPAYCASKHAVIGLTRSAAAAHAGNGIRINAVCPAPIETRMMRSIEAGASHNDPERTKRAYIGRIPAGRYGEPEEVAALVAFLLGDEAPFINGSLYTIDGAMTPY